MFTRQDCDPTALAVELAGWAGQETEPVLLLYDAGYEHQLGGLTVPGLQLLPGRCSPQEREEEEENIGMKRLGRRFSVSSWEEVQGAGRAVYVGRGGQALLGLACSLPRPAWWVWQDGALLPAGLLVPKLLMRRYFLVEKVKDSERVGLLVGTLATARFPEILARLRRILKQAGKKVYTFLVGKPNVAKLANFPEVDVFVLVACPETSLPDTKEFLQPVVTPWEAELACLPGRDWTGDLETDYRQLLEGGQRFAPLAEQVKDEADEEDKEGDVSLLTGRVRGGAGPATTSGALAVVNDKTVSVLHQGGGGEYLAGRTWGGLQQDLGRTEVGKLVQGRRGIAAGYLGEGKIEDQL